MPSSNDAGPGGPTGRRLLERTRAAVRSAVTPAPETGAAPSSDGEFLTKSYDGRSYRLYVPGGYTPEESVPLVVMLHGCRQTPDGFAAETGMNAVAEAETFLVAYPKQSRRANIGRCWNWFDDGETTRERGEVARIAGTTVDVMDDYAIDDDRVYIAGLSAGGAMALHTIVAYPDLFAATGVHAGLGYDAADGTLSALYRMKRGGSDPRELADAAYDAMGERARPIPTIVFHGTDDRIVDVENGEQVARLMWRASHLAIRNGGGVGATEADDPTTVRGDGGGPVEPDTTEIHEVGPHTCERSEFHDEAGRVVVERWLVEGMGHAWSGGGTGGRYVAPAGPDASRETWRFFASHTKSELEARQSGVDTSIADFLPDDLTKHARLARTVRSIEGRIRSWFP